MFEPLELTAFEAAAVAPADPERGADYWANLPPCLCCGGTLEERGDAIVCRRCGNVTPN